MKGTASHKKGRSGERSSRTDVQANNAARDDEGGAAKRAAGAPQIERARKSEAEEKEGHLNLGEGADTNAGATAANNADAAQSGRGAVKRSKRPKSDATTSASGAASCGGNVEDGTQPEAKRGLGHPKNHPELLQTSTPRKVKTPAKSKADVAVAKKTGNIGTPRTGVRKRRDGSSGSHPPQSSATAPRAPTRQGKTRRGVPSTDDKLNRGTDPGESNPRPEKASESSKTSIDDRTGASTSNSVEASLKRGKGNKHSRTKRIEVTRKPQQSVKKAGPTGDKGGSQSQDQGRKRKGKVVVRDDDAADEDNVKASRPEEEDKREKLGRAKGRRSQGKGKAKATQAKEAEVVEGEKLRKKGGGAATNGSTEWGEMTTTKKRLALEWECPRCGGHFKGQQASVYHIVKKVCDKVLTTLYAREGMYWDGKQKVILSEEVLAKPVGFFSPPYPTLAALGELNDVAARSMAAKVGDAQTATCQFCERFFSTKAGYKYHMDRNVCGGKDLTGEKDGEDGKYSMPGADGGGGRRSRKRRKTIAGVGAGGGGSANGRGPANTLVQGLATPPRSGTALGMFLKSKRGVLKAANMMQEKAATLDLDKDLEPGAKIDEALSLLVAAEGAGREIALSKSKPSWRDVPGLREWVSTRDDGVEGGGKASAASSEAAAKIAWKVTTVSNWASQTRGGVHGGGKLLPEPVRVEMVPEEGWSASGLNPAEGSQSWQRSRLPPLKSVGATVSKGEAPEYLLNAGGSVWGIDALVRPSRRDVGGNSDDWDLYLAVATGPLRQTDDPIDEMDAFLPPQDGRSPLPTMGQRASGPGLLQIWRAKNASTGFAPPSSPRSVHNASKRNRKRRHEDDKSSKAPDGMFELAYGIAHNGGAALKCKWAPEGSARKEGISRGPLGLLATVFEDGSLRVYLCPDLDEVSRKAGGVIGKGGEDGGLVLEVDPVLHVELKRAMLTCLDWNTHDPSLLLAGASDGTVCVWKVSDGGGACGVGGVNKNAPPFRQFACSGIGIFEPADAFIRDVAWCPHSREMFASTAQGNLLSVWELSTPFEPLCSFPRRNNRSEGAAIRWAPGRSGIWVSATSRPFLYFLDFFDGGIREVVYKGSRNVERCSPGASKEEVEEKTQKNIESITANPVEDAVSGLDVLREDPTDPRADSEALLQQIHLVAWTAPTGQVRVTAAACRESSPWDHHRESAAFFETAWRSKRSQYMSLVENKAMHRVEYVHPSDNFVKGATSWPVEGGERSGATSGKASHSSFLRVFTGCHSEGNRTVLPPPWKETMAPLTGLLNCTRLVHVPRAPMNTTAAPSAHDYARAKPTCVLLSGGHGGLVRCSAVPNQLPKTRQPRPTERSRNKVARMKVAAAAAAAVARKTAAEVISTTSEKNASASTNTVGV